MSMCMCECRALFCLFPNFSFLSTQNAMDSHRRRRLHRGRRPHTPSVASALSSSAGPQRPRASVSVPPARLRRRPRPRHQCPPGASPELFRVFCLRCAVHTATDPAATCRFDRPESKKCRYCREQKSLCDPVSISHCSSFFLYLTFDRSRLPWPPGANLFSGLVASLGRLLPSPCISPAQLRLNSGSSSALRPGPNTARQERAVDSIFNIVEPSLSSCGASGVPESHAHVKA